MSICQYFHIKYEWCMNWPILFVFKWLCIFFGLLWLTVTWYSHIAYLHNIWKFLDFNELNVTFYLYVIRNGNFVRFPIVRGLIYSSEWYVQIWWIRWTYYFRIGAKSCRNSYDNDNKLEVFCLMMVVCDRLWIKFQFNWHCCFVFKLTLDVLFD